MISIHLKESMSETLDILKHIDKIYLEKIPEDFMNFLKQNRSEEYIPNLNHNLKLSEMDLKEQTKDLLSAIYLNYWCNEGEQVEYTNFLNENEKIYEREINEKYNPDKLFTNKNKSLNSKMLITNEESKNILEKIIDFIKNIFKNRK